MAPMPGEAGDHGVPAGGVSAHGGHGTQSASSANSLPPLNVEAKPAKKTTGSQSGAVTAAALAAITEPTPEQKAASPYVDPVAPYKVQQSGSSKITEPLADTPKTITAISKKVMDNKALTSVREVARQTPGVTLGFAEGGNAFGDSLYIRGFNARGDIFVDGMRDPGNASRETFAMEQVEVSRARAVASLAAALPANPRTTTVANWR